MVELCLFEPSTEQICIEAETFMIRIDFSCCVRPGASPLAVGSMLILYPLLCQDTLPERMLDFSYFGDQIGKPNQLLGGVSAGEN